MTQKEKELLIKDLCARLPYGVKLRYVEDLVVKKESHIITLNNIYLEHIINGDADIKPYLRPMSSMTEEESMEFTKLFSKWHDDELFDYIEEGVDFSIWKHKGISPVIFDWLNSHNFDYRGLISMGLALEASEDMYKKD